ncbi:conserved protein of unknown function [Modestobacter italicus]|uniref:SnoaL-like domain-containing protein n=1 Tax=Modestobacter italicus (strain DSM 44449 / CECT 9708 / BC 501) TaxID=2732864 RepID=I4F181_MODI5|nr:nuclear transport factor 2 family protein [Modestobacter marinus]CCH89394.1 conserved protein of unknown function [Modestobacter marinus]
MFEPMSEHPHVTVVRTAYDAFAKGDLTALDEVLAEDVRWHLPGRNQFSGTYAGPPAVYEMFGRLMAATEGSFRIEVRTVLADDEHVLALVDVTARSGERSCAVTDVHVCRMRGGRIAEFWATAGDQYALDAVLG